VKVDVVIMPLLVTPRSLNRVVALDQQKLFYSQVLHEQFSVMSKCGAFVNGGQEESHAFDKRNEEEGELIICRFLLFTLATCH
jgi:hypothetical protein